MKKIVLMLAVLALAMTGFVLSAANATKPDPNHKDWVCKYVGKPGVDERFSHLIWVDTAATQGTWFNDAQGRSFVLLADAPHDPVPSETGCPGYTPPTPTPTPTPTETPTPTDTPSVTPTPTDTPSVTPTPTETPTVPTEPPAPTPTLNPGPTPTDCVSNDSCLPHPVKHKHHKKNTFSLPHTGA